MTVIDYNHAVTRPYLTNGEGQPWLKCRMQKKSQKFVVGAVREQKTCSYLHALNAIALKFARDGTPAQFATTSFDPKTIALNVSGSTPLSSTELMKGKLTRF